MEGIAELKEPKSESRSPIDSSKETLENGILALKGPKIGIDIFYGSHQTERDQQGLKKAFEEADVYVPEIPGWKPETLKIFRSVSEGRLEPSNAVRLLGSFFPKLAELTMLYDSNKPVVFIDVPVEAPIFLGTVGQLNKLAELTDSPALNTGFRGYLERIRNVIKSLAQTQKDREDYMLLNLRLKITELLREYPELKGRKRLDVLLNLGAAHTNLYRSLKKNNQEADRTFNDMPTIFSHIEEGIRRSLFGKDIKDELVAKISLELLFKNELEQWVSETAKDSIEQNKIYRAIFSQISIKDAEDLFNRVKRGKDPKLLFGSILKARGLRKPKTKKDVEELLVHA